MSHCSTPWWLPVHHEQAWAHGVTIDLIEPGPVTPISSLAVAMKQSAHGPAWQERGNVSPQDIAEGVAFLCSDGGEIRHRVRAPLWLCRGMMRWRGAGNGAWIGWPTGHCWWWGRSVDGG